MTQKMKDLMGRQFRAILLVMAQFWIFKKCGPIPSYVLLMTALEVIDCYPLFLNRVLLCIP